jgi:hypothetical protein
MDASTYRRPPSTRCLSLSQFSVTNPDTWPIFWRVVAPAAGADGRDVVFTEADDRAEAQRLYDRLHSSGYPVRLERVSCGPLPTNAALILGSERFAMQRHATTSLREVLGVWSGGID